MGASGVKRRLKKNNRFSCFINILFVVFLSYITKKNYYFLLKIYQHIFNMVINIFIA